MKMQEYKALGLMTGSSLDGIDLAYCRFRETHKGWEYTIEVADTLEYPEKWKNFLIESLHVDTLEFLERDVIFGRYLGQRVKAFVQKHHLHPDLVASHGHTLFHQPDRGFSVQLGSGQALAIESGIPTVSDFRTKDILLGGQGAPLVPIGDEWLFPDYDYCLNIGGIANISYREQNLRKAFDVCPANQLLNHLSRLEGMPYDKGGKLARKGKLSESLLNALNADPFYQLGIPKSLSNEYVREKFIPLLDDFNLPNADKLFTTVKHIAKQIAQVCQKKDATLLVTGGGAHNAFLIDAIRQSGDFQVIIPDKRLVDFKEALIFAFMGVLRMQGRNNCLASSTGASCDSMGGDVFLP